MPAALFVMVIVLGVAVAVVAIVAMGMQGAGRDRAPELANAMAETARHLNGDAEPPKGLVDFFDEIPDPKKGRSASSASSSTSAS